MKLFFNYRREDTEDLAGRLHDRLCSEFGAENIFTDVASLRGGDEWKAVLEKSVQASDVVLALMGRQWLTCVNKSGEPRLFAEDDIVRFELEAARRHGRLVIPLLAQDIKEPEKHKLPPSIQWLMDYQAIPIRSGGFFRDDVARLVGELKRIGERLRIKAEFQAQAAATPPPQPAANSTVRCSVCTAECDKGSQCCHSCGAALWNDCPGCGTRVQRALAYCTSCGTHLARLRELNEVTERTGRSLVLVAAISDPTERLAAIAVLGPELEATVQAYADHPPLLEMRIRLRELSRDSQRDRADRAFQSGQLALAEQYYRELRQLDPLSVVAAERLQEIESRRTSAFARCRELVGRGSYKRAVEELQQLLQVFPGHAEAASELQRCSGIAARIQTLVPDGLRELRRQRKYLQLERELIWLRDQRVPIRNFDEWLTEARERIQKANSLFQNAESEVRSGRLRQVQKLADEVLQEVADFTAAQDLLKSAGSAETTIRQLNLLVQRKHFCKAYQLVLQLERQGILDSRLPKLAAATRVEITALDSALRTLLMLAVVGFVAGKFLSELLLSTVGKTSGGSSEEVAFLSSVVPWGVSMLLTGVVFLATPLRQEKLIRLVLDWLRLRLLWQALLSLFRWRSRRMPEDRAEAAAADPEPEKSAAVSPAAVPPVATGTAGATGATGAAQSTSATGVKPNDVQGRAAADGFRRPDVSGGAGSAGSMAGNSQNAVDPVLLRSVDLNRQAALLELLTVIAAVFCVANSLGADFWDWLLRLKFDDSLADDSRSIVILRPLKSLIPASVLWFSMSAAEPQQSWRRILKVGALGTLCEFIVAILFPSMTWVMGSLTLVALLVVTAAQMFEIPVRRAIFGMLLAVVGGLLSMSTVAIPLLAVVAMLGNPFVDIDNLTLSKVSWTASLICQFFLLLVPQKTLLVSRLAADLPAVRGSLATGISWAAAMFAVLLACWMRNLLHLDVQDVGVWILLLMILQFLPILMTGRTSVRLQLFWLTLSGSAFCVMVLLCWLTPMAGFLLPVTAFLLSAHLVMSGDSPSLSESGRVLVEQLKLRQSRRMSEYRLLIGRRH
jgi:tetratricopeptide (TPR) repeat protein